MDDSMGLALVFKDNSRPEIFLCCIHLIVQCPNITLHLIGVIDTGFFCVLRII